MADKSLKSLGIRLAKADALLVEVLAYRMQVVRQVGAYKMKNGQKIIRRKVERQRMITVRALARKHGMSAGFVGAVWYLIMAEACRLQIDQMQNENTYQPKNSPQLRKLRKKFRKLVK